MGFPAMPSAGPPDAGVRFAGVQQTKIIPPPGAGADWLYAVEGGTYQRIVSLYARFTASAVVANRFPRPRVIDGDANIIWAGPAQQAIVAGQTFDICMFPGATSNASPAGVNVLTIPAPVFWLPPGSRVLLSTLGADAGDVYDRIRITVEELDQGPLGEYLGTDPTAGI